LAATKPDPEKLNVMLDPWRYRMLELRFLDLFSRYLPILFTADRIDWNVAAVEIEDWAGELTPASTNPPTSGNVSEKTASHSADVLILERVSERRPSLRMLADVPLDDDKADRLNFKPYATALAGLIDNPNTSTPLVLSINAP
jgi:hypothetical protein